MLLLVCSRVAAVLRVQLRARGLYVCGMWSQFTVHWTHSGGGARRYRRLFDLAVVDLSRSSAVMVDEQLILNLSAYLRFHLFFFVVSHFSPFIHLIIYRCTFISVSFNVFNLFDLFLLNSLFLFFASLSLCVLLSLSHPFIIILINFFVYFKPKCCSSFYDHFYNNALTAPPYNYNIFIIILTFSLCQNQFAVLEIWSGPI